jgi:hypothetical protein
MLRVNGREISMGWLEEESKLNDLWLRTCGILAAQNEILIEAAFINGKSGECWIARRDPEPST